MRTHDDQIGGQFPCLPQNLVDDDRLDRHGGHRIVNCRHEALESLLELLQVLRRVDVGHVRADTQGWIQRLRRRQDRQDGDRSVLPAGDGHGALERGT